MFFSEKALGIEIPLLIICLFALTTSLRIFFLSETYKKFIYRKNKNHPNIGRRIQYTFISFLDYYVHEGTLLELGDGREIYDKILLKFEYGPSIEKYVPRTSYIFLEPLIKKRQIKKSFMNKLLTNIFLAGLFIEILIYLPKLIQWVLTK